MNPSQWVISSRLGAYFNSAAGPLWFDKIVLATTSRCLWLQTVTYCPGNCRRECVGQMNSFLITHLSQFIYSNPRPARQKVKMREGGKEGRTSGVKWERRMDEMYEGKRSRFIHESSSLFPHCHSSSSLRTYRNDSFYAKYECFFFLVWAVQSKWHQKIKIKYQQTSFQVLFVTMIYFWHYYCSWICLICHKKSYDTWTVYTKCWQDTIISIFEPVASIQPPCSEPATYFPVAILSDTHQDSSVSTPQGHVYKCIPDHLSMWSEWSDVLVGVYSCS